MSLLIPTNLSNIYKGTRRRLDKNDMMFACDYPTCTQESNGLENKNLVPDCEQEDRDNTAKDNELRQKRLPIPVALVDPDPVQMLEPDEYGAELGKEARVWKVYVQETDKWDRELVDGWNKSLDVILGGIVLCRIHRGSSMLQQDPNVVSATALLAILHALIAIKNNSSVDLNESVILNSGASSTFVASKHAVIINTLWYLSLSLSIATSLLAMLAKDWCHSFIANRTGHPWGQALRRQQKWAMIESWKMQELITVLPSLIHLSLLLFAVGLSIYVWDMNITAAIPVICVSGGAFTFYLWSSLMASIVKLFPYTTIISRTFQSDLLHHQYNQFITHSKGWTTQILSWVLMVIKYILITLLIASAIPVGLVCLPLLLLEFFHSIEQSGRALEEFDWTNTQWHNFTFWAPSFILENLGAELFYDFIQDSFARAEKYILLTRMHTSKDNQDKMISQALQWLIENCETPSSIAIALQAIAGASYRIPTEPLKSCHATLQIFQRLVSSSLDSQTKADTELYTRALTFLGSSIKPSKGLPGTRDIQGSHQTDESEEIQAGYRTEDIEVIIWDLKAEHERQIVELINTTQILPTKENIDALSEGSSAASLSLRLLKGDTKSAAEVFSSIMTKLYDASYGSKKLDPAALQSLANAAVLLTLCSTSSLSPDIVRMCIEQHILSLPTFGFHSNSPPQPQVTNVLVAETAFLLCILLNPCTLPYFPPNKLHIKMCSRAKQALDMLTSGHFKSPLSQSTFYRIGLLTILFNPEQYNITWNMGNAIDIKRMDLCNSYLYSGLMLSCDIQRGLCDPPESINGKTKISEFLSAVNQIFELRDSEETQSSVAIPVVLPAPVYCTLVYFSCLLKSNDQQAQCQHLLSRSSFPKLDKYFLAAIRAKFSHRTFLNAMWGIYESFDIGPASSNQPHRLPIIHQWRTQYVCAVLSARSHHLLATQFWLLLCHIGDASTFLRKELKSAIELFTGLGIRDQGVDAVKVALEDKIIQTYTRGHHFGVYSARIIECILEGRNASQYSDISQQITEELKLVSSNIRLLSSFLDLPTKSQSGSPLVPIPTLPDDTSIANSVPSSVSYLTSALNTELPPSATSTPPLVYAAPDEILMVSISEHVAIPVLPGETGNA